jgi:hypothetical protein
LPTLRAIVTQLVKVHLTSRGHASLLQKLD